MDNSIVVSVFCLVYNHEKYLRKCLDGIINQETNFKYECIVHDDASTDNSQSIILEYANKYPSIIIPFIEQENQYSKGNSIDKIIYPLLRGKYIAFCEGDDYWFDSSKLQSQFDIMERMPNITFCVHRVQCINEDGTPNSRCFPSEPIVNGLNTSQTILDWVVNKNKYLFHTSSYFIKRDTYSIFANDPPEFVKVSKTAGSGNLMIIAANEGDTFFIDKNMSCYRLLSKGSWTEKQKNNVNIKCAHLEEWIKSRSALKNYLDFRYTKGIDRSILDNEFMLYRLRKEYKRCLQTKYRMQMSQLTYKEIVYIVLFAYFPHVMEKYEKKRKRE